eukprot:3939322-Rhodomonas_salina.1
MASVCARSVCLPYLPTRPIRDLPTSLRARYPTSLPPYAPDTLPRYATSLCSPIRYHPRARYATSYASDRTLWAETAYAGRSKTLSRSTGLPKSVVLGGAFLVVVWTVVLRRGTGADRRGGEGRRGGRFLVGADRGRSRDQSG